jgi:ADP-heptose:LPS heptosyltransferase
VALTRTERPADTDREPVLVLRALGLGDALAGIPALRGLRRRFPRRRLLLAGHGEAARLLQRHRLVDDVVPTTGLDDPPPGLALGPHLAVNLHGRGPQSHRLLQAGRPTTLVAFAEPASAHRGPGWDPEEHEVIRWCRLVGSIGGVCGPEDLRLAPRDDADARRGPIVLHPGAAGGSRRWPIQRFAGVAAVLAVLGQPVVVTGSAAEAQLCSDLVVAAGLPSEADLAGRLDLAALMGLLREARLLICGDTGVAHLATALATPSVLLFGPTPPDHWGPLIDPDRHRVLWPGYRGRPPGDPQGAVPDPTLLRITTQDVLSAAGELLLPPEHRPAHPLTLP